MKVYKWRAVDNFLTFKNEETFTEILDSPIFTGESVGMSWVNKDVVDVEENAKKYDCCCLVGNPIITKKAVDVLYELIAASAEFLPYNYYNEEAKYFAVNVTNVVNCLDIPSSEVKRNEKSGSIRVIYKHAFYPDMLLNQVVFKTPQLKKSYVFVTDVFVEHIKSSRLTGFEFEEVWDSEAKPSSVTQPPVVMKEGPYSYKQAMDLVEAGKSVASGKWILQMVENELYLGSFEQNGAYSWMIPYYIPPILLELEWYVIDPVNMKL